MSYQQEKKFYEELQQQFQQAFDQQGELRNLVSYKFKYGVSQPNTHFPLARVIPEVLYMDENPREYDAPIAYESLANGTWEMPEHTVYFPDGTSHTIAGMKGSW
jgi:hypothetical protein